MNRTCAEASIPHKYCSCLLPYNASSLSLDMDLDGELVGNLSERLGAAVHEGWPACAGPRPDSPLRILSARLLSASAAVRVGLIYGKEKELKALKVPI